MRKTPIALFAYNRPEHVSRALATLSNCARLEECHLHIFCDGAKGNPDAETVAKTRQVVHDWAPRLNAKTIEQPTNLGLARSISGGVTELCKKYGRVIVVEDDHEVSRSFLDYMLQALARYENEPNVYQVSGYMFPVKHPAESDAFFLPLITTWGWATWERAWQVFDWDASGAIQQLADPAQRYAFNLRDSYPYMRLLKDRLNGQNQSWGILWWWSVFSVGGLALHPRRSLVSVGGFDGSGVHCGKSGGESEVQRANTLNYECDSPIKWPAKVMMDESAFYRITEYLGEQDGRGAPSAEHNAVGKENPSGHGDSSRCEVECQNAS